MGLRIIHRSTAHRPLTPEHMLALSFEAKRWAERRVGDVKDLSASFIAKAEDVRKLDTLHGSITTKTTDLCIQIRAAGASALHDEKTFDLKRILNLI